MQNGEKVLTYVALNWVFILGLSTCLQAQETGKEAGKEKGRAATPTPSGTPERRILPDGTVEIVYPNGTIKRIPPTAVTGTPGSEATKAGEAVVPGLSAAGELDSIPPLVPSFNEFDQPT